MLKIERQGCTRSEKYKEIRKGSVNAEYRAVPCGKCLECLKAYQNQWSARMFEEFKASNRVATFVTFTYNENTVPKNYLYDGKIYESKPLYGYDNSKEVEGTRVRRMHATAPEEVLPEEVREYITPFRWEEKNKQIGSEVQEALDNNLPISFNSVRQADLKYFIDKFRRHCKKQFKFFGTSEYGPQTSRPHYHFCFFNMTPEDLRPLINDWKAHMGFVDAELVDIASGEGAFCYVSKYCSKGSFENSLCSKDFFYFHPDEERYAEYHSKDYEYAIKFFGINEPICNKTFHMISKGLGEAYAKDKENIAYHAGKNVKPRERIEKIISNKKYTFSNGKQISLPKYYYEKILGATVRASVTKVQEERDYEIYLNEFSVLAAAEPWRTDTEIDYLLLQQEENQRNYRRKAAFEGLNKTYRKSRI